MFNVIIFIYVVVVLLLMMSDHSMWFKDEALSPPAGRPSASHLLTNHLFTLSVMNTAVITVTVSS